ncbi:Putative beta-lactamase/transpeptidase, glutaminase, STAS domain superfamily [Septoria linicola]|uniref:glutaminase n=1 Tax=Septoria linicola TaxID=215465 RepID=A0A9Q9B1P8_9PEZI|nr:putative beta-lactamase/transpeptidase, glutaminase, STAS domain superfamily [Septoria linicola]USW55812.1 Putative beta-lactamase/transpeptidase, glutaminase, STAS domain superfamily [Septoria linicola]
MKSPIPDYLQRVLDHARPDDSGAPAGYIDVLAKADTSRLGVAIAMVDGNIYSAGDDNVEFSIQSISKAFVYALAIEDAGLDVVLSKIGVEPSGDAFNELSLHEGSNRPMNPMINAGAITAHSLVVGPNATAEQRTDRILNVMSKLANRDLKVCEEVYEAELKDWDRNMGLAHMLKAASIISCDPREVVKGYIRQCSINVTVRDLALMAATLSNAGYHPVTGERIFPRTSVRQVLSVMTTCGMYDAAGDWVSNVGIPAKSGVAGGILGALPGQVGLAAFSPKLDDKGNSVRGVTICEQLSHDMGLHMMDVSQIARSTVNTAIVTIKTAATDKEHPGEECRAAIFHMRGAVRFSGAEILTRALTRNLGEADPQDPGSGAYADACAVVLSFREVFSLNKVARRVIHEDIARLLNDERSVVVIDPTGVLRWEGEGKDLHPKIVESQDEAREFIGGAGCSATVQEDW